MVKNFEQYMYLKNLYRGTAKTVSDKLFNKFSAYINHRLVKTTLECSRHHLYIPDPVGAFTDTVCRQLIMKYSDKKEAVIYQIISPYHKKEILCGVSVKDNSSVCKDIQNIYVCKASNLYTIKYSSKDIKFLEISDNLFRISNKIQQKQL